MFFFLQEAGVGPMTPLAENDVSPIRHNSIDGDGGEETETAPEADDEVGERSQKKNF